VDEPVPVRRAAIGCLAIAALVAAVMLVVRPAIFSVAPPRGDAAVIVGTATELEPVPVRHDVVLTRSYGWAGELPAGDGRAQLAVLVSAATPTAPTAVNAWSPGADGCAVEVRGDRLADCRGRTWTFDGAPIDAGDTALERFPVTLDGGSVVVDLTRTLGD
jgi:hypothetical protein